MATDADVVALINRDDERFAIWHIVIGPGYPMSRLCGAWVNPTVNPSLLATRLLLPFGGRLADDLRQFQAASVGVFDPAATLDAISARIAELDARHKESLTKAGKPRAPLSWPSLPQALDWDNPPPPLPGVTDDPLTSATIGVARWIANLADAWASVEVNRLSREHLADGEVAPRPMPVVLTNMASA